MNNLEEIALMEPAQLNHCAETLARAFFVDPFFEFVLPNPRKRERLLPWLYRKLIRIIHDYGKVFVSSHLDGVALWLGPKQTNLPLVGIIKTGLFLFPCKLSPAEFKRSRQLDTLSSQLHRRSMTRPHLYLFGIGVEPALQGKGLGRALVQAGLAFAAQLHVPAYLDTYNPHNLSFYASLGFQIIRSEKPTSPCPQIWAMRWSEASS